MYSSYITYEVTNDLTIVCGKCIHMLGSDALWLLWLLGNLLRCHYHLLPFFIGLSDQIGEIPTVYFISSLVHSLCDKNGCFFCEMLKNAI